MGVITRGNKLWIRFRDVGGKWRNTSTGYDVGQDELAAAMLDEVNARVRKALAGEVVTTGPLTVRGFAEEWIRDRRALDLDWKGDQSRLKHHVLPVIGDMKIADVRTRHLIDLFHRIRTSAELAPRTVYNVYSVVAVMFRDAELADRIEQSPSCLDARRLGPLVDKDPEWRSGATREEVEAIISNLRIPADRHMVYALEFRAGVRHGEAAGLRWRHYQPS